MKSYGALPLPLRTPPPPAPHPARPAGRGAFLLPQRELWHPPARAPVRSLASRRFDNHTRRPPARSESLPLPAKVGLLVSRENCKSTHLREPAALANCFQENRGANVVASHKRGAAGSSSRARQLTQKSAPTRHIEQCPSFDCAQHARTRAHNSMARRLCERD